MYGATSSAANGVLEAAVDGVALISAQLYTASPVCGSFFEIYVPDASATHTVTLTLHATNSGLRAQVPLGLTLVGATYVLSLPLV